MICLNSGGFIGVVVNSHQNVPTSVGTEISWRFLQWWMVSQLELPSFPMRPEKKFQTPKKMPNSAVLPKLKLYFTKLT